MYKTHAQRQKCIHKNKNDGCMELIFHTKTTLNVIVNYSAN